MKKTLFRKVICFILSVTMLLSVVCVSAFAASDAEPSWKRDPASEEENPYSASTLEEMKALVGTLSYLEYLNSYSEQRGDYIARLNSGATFNEISVDVTSFVTDEVSKPKSAFVVRSLISPVPSSAFQ